MALGYINPQLALVLAAQQGKFPAPPSQVQPQAPVVVQPHPAGFDPNDPLAPLPDQGPVLAPQADSVNDGINSVGRPADQADPAAAAQKAADHNKELKKLIRQGKGEALLALGASLLSARTFGEGLSNGLVAYQKAIQASHDRTTPKHENIGDGTYDKITDPVDSSVSYERTPYADEKQRQLKLVADGRLAVADTTGQYGLAKADLTSGRSLEGVKYRSDTGADTADKDRVTKERVAQWANTSRETVARINGFYRGQNRSPNKLEVAAANAAKQAPDNLSRYDRIEQMLDSGDSGAGAGLLAKVKRGVVTATGQSAFGVDVNHMQLLDRDLHTIEAQAGALLLGGQGQVSDGERKMVHDSMPNMETNPDAIKTILQVLRAKAKRDALGLSISADGDTYPRGPEAPTDQTTSSGVKWSIVH